jgi:hypothetical protein
VKPPVTSSVIQLAASIISPDRTSMCILRRGEADLEVGRFGKQGIIANIFRLFSSFAFLHDCRNSVFRMD